MQGGKRHLKAMGGQISYVYIYASVERIMTAVSLFGDEGSTSRASYHIRYQNINRKAPSPDRR